MEDRRGVFVRIWGPTVEGEEQFVFIIKHDCSYCYARRCCVCLFPLYFLKNNKHIT